MEVVLVKIGCDVMCYNKHISACVYFSLIQYSACLYQWYGGNSSSPFGGRYLLEELPPVAPGYWRLCHLYLVASKVLSGINILPKDGDTAWRIVCGSLYGSGQEVKLLFCSDSVDCSHVTGFYLSAIKAGWDMQCYGQNYDFPNSYVEDLTLSTSECDSIWSQGL